MKKIFIYISLFISFFLSRGQEWEFSQYYTASLYLNPAFAGVFTTPTLNVNYKQTIDNQLVPRQQSQASFVFPIIISGGSETRQFGGVGVTGYNYLIGENGVEREAGGAISYAQTLKLAVVSPDVLSIGIQAGYKTRSINYSALTWGSQYSSYLASTQGFDETRPTSVSEYDSQLSSLFINAGVMYYYNRNRNYLLYNYSAFSGISVTNANRPNTSLVGDSDYRTNLVINYHGAFEFNLKRFFVIPTAMVKYYATNMQYNLGSYFTYATNASRGFSLDNRGLELVFGAWYRIQDSFLFIVGVNHDKYLINVSYDLNNNLFYPEEVNGLLSPAFEISLRYSLDKSNRLKNVSNPLF